ncbi:hypothetical protein K3495_g5862 [Podosphaera aphanis]|nr:hypothetical protein K3495_g5862 [Podosphaera aphanis]
MTKSSKYSPDDLATLAYTVQLTLDALKDWLKPSNACSRISTEGIKINALDLAHDTASIIRAQSTQLYLLTRNKPFPPSAPTKILRELISGPIPNLVFIAGLCDPKVYTQTMSNELDFQLNRLVAELTEFVRGIPLDKDVIYGCAKNTSDVAQKGDALVRISKTWGACDALIALRDRGISGLFVQRSDEYKDLLEDAFEELQEWENGLSDTEDFDELDDKNEEYTIQAAENQIFASQNYIPEGDPHKIRPRLQSTKKRLRLIILMFQAIIKRRFKTLSSLPNLQPESELEMNQIMSNREKVRSLDCVLDSMKEISDITDNLACSFYDMNIHQIDSSMEECFSVGSKIPEPLINNWEGERDSFSAWVCRAQITFEKF